MPKTIVDSDPATVVIDSNSTAKINVGILISIIVVAVTGALYLQNIQHLVTTTNDTLEGVEAELAQLNASDSRHSEELIKLQSKVEGLEKRIEKLEQ